MYCPKCGEKNDNGSKFCGNCGLKIEEEKIETKSNAGGLKALSIVAFVFSILLFPVGLILSIIGLATCNSYQKKNNEKLSFNAFNIAGLIVSIILTLLTLLIVGIIALVFGALDLSKSNYVGEWKCSVSNGFSGSFVVSTVFTKDQITWGKYNDLKNNALVGSYKLKSYEYKNGVSDYRLEIEPIFMVENGKESSNYAKNVTMNLKLEKNNMIVTTSQTSLRYYCTKVN